MQHEVTPSSPCVCDPSFSSVSFQNTVCKYDDIYHQNDTAVNFAWQLLLCIFSYIWGQTGPPVVPEPLTDVSSIPEFWIDTDKPHKAMLI